MGDRLFSINELSSECSLSRDTVQKAYDLLEKEKIIEAVKGKGFYIYRTDVLSRYRVLLIFNKLSNYKKMIYDSFVETMGNKGIVDLRIHHCDARVLEDIISKSHCEYDHYVIMPHFYEQASAARAAAFSRILKTIYAMPSSQGSPRFINTKNSSMCSLR